MVLPTFSRKYLPGIRVRFADVSLRREIDHVRDAVLADDLLDQLAVFDIAFVERTELDGPAMSGMIVNCEPLTPSRSLQVWLRVQPAHRRLPVRFPSFYYGTVIGRLR